jgi:hypothetical protein
MSAEMILNQMNRMFDAPNPLEMFMSGQQSAQTLDAQRMQNLLSQNQVNQLPFMNQFDATKLQQVQQQMESQRIQDEASQIDTRNAQVSTAAKEALAMPESRRLPFLVDFANKLDPTGEKSKTLLAMQAEDPASVTAALEQWASSSTGDGPAQVQYLEYLKKGKTPEQKREIDMRAAGLEAKAGTLTQTERSVVDPTMGEAVTKQLGKEAYTKAIMSEIGKLEAEGGPGIEVAKRLAQSLADIKAQTEPTIARDIAFAQQTAKDQAEAAATKAKLNKALTVYSGASNRLMKSLGETETGPIIGLIPAVTGNAKTAERVINQMGPVLKSVFRQAGEGAWTNFDQIALMEIAADRTLEPEARVKVMGALDALVRETAGQPVSLYSKELGEGVTMQDVYQESIDSGLPIYEVMDALGIEAGK